MKTEENSRGVTYLNNKQKDTRARIAIFVDQQNLNLHNGPSSKEDLRGGLPGKDIVWQYPPVTP